MTLKHSPGPWSLDEDGDIVASNGLLVVAFDDRNTPDDADVELLLQSVELLRLWRIILNPQEAQSEKALACLMAANVIARLDGDQ